MAQHQFIGARDMMENRAISPFAVLDFVLPYAWVMSLSRATIMMLGGICGNSGWGQLGNILMKIFLFFVAVFVLWVPMNLFFRAGTFWFASLVRLVKGVGGKESLGKNIWFFGCYCAIFGLVYVPWIIPYFVGYVDWSTIAQWLNLT